ncbi:MAG: hypothetical protein QM751_08390 [Paludibacteraceae bacterium]
MGACFCNGDYRPFLASQVKYPEKYFRQGNFIDEEGTILGSHHGYPFFTVGQRRGFGLQLNRAMFVKEIRAYSNEVVLAPLKNMYKISFIVQNYRIVSPAIFTDDVHVTVRIRYRKQNTPCRITILDDVHLKIELKEPLESIAPGQSAVLYLGEKVLGGGFIS